MAGDWIAMRCDLATDPAVIAVSLALGLDEDTVVGKLHRLWSWFDQQTENGCARSVTPEWIDRFIGTSGFARAMESARWLKFRSGNCVMPKFDTYNGKSGKNRVLSARRMQRKRCADGVTPAQPQNRTEQYSTEDNKDGRLPYSSSGLRANTPVPSPANEDGVRASNGDGDDRRTREVKHSKLTNRLVATFEGRMKIRTAHEIATTRRFIQRIIEAGLDEQACQLAAEKCRDAGCLNPFGAWLSEMKRRLQ